MAVDDGLVKPYTPVTVTGRTVGVLGRTVTLNALGFPDQIESRFSIEMTHVGAQARRVLTGPVALVVQRAGEAPTPWKGSGVTLHQTGSRGGCLAGARRGRSAEHGHLGPDGLRRQHRVHRRRQRLPHDRCRRHPPRDSRRGRCRPVSHGPRLQRREAAGQPGLEVGRQEQPGLGLDWRHQRRPAVHAEGRQVRPAAEHQLLHAQAAGDAGVVVQRRQGRLPAGGEGRGHVPGELLQRRPHHRAGRHAPLQFPAPAHAVQAARHRRPVQHALLPRLQAGRRGGAAGRQRGQRAPRERHQSLHQLPVLPAGGDEGLHRPRPRRAACA